MPGLLEEMLILLTHMLAGTEVLVSAKLADVVAPAVTEAVDDWLEYPVADAVTV